MGKNGWGSKFAAELRKPDDSIGRSVEAGSPEAAGEGEADVSERGGLVILDAHRRSGRAKAADGARKSERPRRPRGESSSKLGEQIGDQLRNLYKAALEEPIPERFLDLLNKLEDGTISPCAEARAREER